MLPRTGNVSSNPRKVESLTVITWNDQESDDDDDSELPIRHALRPSLTSTSVNSHQIRDGDPGQSPDSGEIDTFRTAFTDYCLTAEAADTLIEEAFLSTAEPTDSLTEEALLSTAELTDAVTEEAFPSTPQYAANNEIQEQESGVYAANTRTQTIHPEGSDDAGEGFRCSIETHSSNAGGENAEEGFPTYLEPADYYLEDTPSDGSQSHPMGDSPSISMQDAEEAFTNEDISMVSPNHSLVIDDGSQDMDEDEIQSEEVAIESENENLFIVCDFHSENETDNNAEQRLRYSSGFPPSHFTALFGGPSKRQRQR